MSALLFYSKFDDAEGLRGGFQHGGVSRGVVQIHHMRSYICRAACAQVGSDGAQIHCIASDEEKGGSPFGEESQGSLGNGRGCPEGEDSARQNAIRLGH